MTLPTIRDVLDEWFLPLDDPGHGQKRDLWWKSTPAFDADLATRFGAASAHAIAGGLDAWTKSPDGALALVILTDQVPRNIHRRSARAFEGDAKAREVARLALARHYPAVYPVPMRQFFYMPFEHSEDLGDQHLACALFESLDDAENLKYAIAHRDIVARFGRFPHRNEVLGRASTDAELDYLRTADRFGQ